MNKKFDRLQSVFSLDQFFKEEMGICARNFEKKILYQNKVCIQFCGNISGKICDSGCVRNYQPELATDPSLLDGIKNITVTPSRRVQCEMVVIQKKSKVVTLLYPLSEKIDKWSKFAKGAGLSAREVEVLQHVLMGKSNAAIAREMHLSITTVKTHLQNIYRRLPKDLNEDLKQRNSSS